jgi:hypothetical protein
MIPHHVNDKIHIFRPQKCNTPYGLYDFEKKEFFLASDSFNVEAIIYEIQLIMSSCLNTFFKDRVTDAFALPRFLLAETLVKWSNQMFTCLNINQHFNTFTFIRLEQSLKIVSAD